MSSRSPRLPIRSLSKLTKSILLTPKSNRLRPPKSLSLPYTKTLTRILHSLSILRIIRSSILNTAFPLSNSLLLFTSITSQTPLAPLLLLLLLNARSLPFTWTFRVLWCVIKVRTRYGVAWARAWGRYFRRYLTAYMIILTRSTRVRNEKNTIHMGSGESGLSLSLTSSRESVVDKDFLKDLHHLRLCEMESWLGSVTPVGAHPFEWEGRYDTWVGPDDSDFNMHMSNSSYPKILDFARTKASLELFPQFLRVGGHVALSCTSSTHFHFINELPLFSKYQIRLSIGAWDEKWCYIVCRFVTVSKKSSKPRNTNIPRILIRPPTPLVNSPPPAPSSNPSSKSSSSPSPTHECNDPNSNSVKLHTIAVSRICFKHGRITVPPAIVFATNGMSVHPWEIEVRSREVGSTYTSTTMGAPLTPPSTPPVSPLTVSTVSPNPPPPSPYLPPRFSHSNPPPSWTHHARPLIDKTQRGSETKLRAFYRGGWRDLVDVDPSSIWHAEPLSSSPSSSEIEIEIDSLKSFNPNFNSNSTSPISSNSSDTDTTSSDDPSSPATPPTPHTPITPFDESDPTLPTPLASPKLTPQTQPPPQKWWDLATATGTNTPADETRKTRLEVCRMLVGGMEGVRGMC
ncbi:hypothetical protein C8J55DRAFT_98666 [Lentinula edodes]|uniref:Thioesterase/thiol ester dehydrase-isomerase n=1 Tax=Lentinula lateritia TaxID=40482 RepID=A0A9W9E0N5_9AGAR|nr:hypothetical protein C8J55DRAFT_98666 [Lentinula edodes]